ncbi:M20/M25/M40 family metallo-hydrolase [Arthrobacter pigmenti]
MPTGTGTRPMDFPEGNAVHRVDAAELCARLIRFDTTNYGEGDSKGERAIAEFIARMLTDSGYSPRVLGPSPERASVVLRVRGSDRDLPGLLVHGHLDVVPAEPEQWSIDPFAGRIQDGYIHGRGAADMKDMVAMMLATLLNWAADGTAPKRDIVFAFVADEEDRGDYGAVWLAEQHPDLFHSVEAAIGEAGGSPKELEAADGSSIRLYPVSTAERGTAHMRLRSSGTSGHGSYPTEDSSLGYLLAALHRINTYKWPLVLSTAVRSFLQQANQALGKTVDLQSDAGVEAAVDALGEAGFMARATIRCSVTPTMVHAGYKVNVIPGQAEAKLDIRSVPGGEEQTLAIIDELLGDKVTREFLSPQGPRSPLEAPMDSAWFAAMREALLRHDPEAVVVPQCLGASTDAKAFAPLGVQCYGFAPHGPDPRGRTCQGVHGIDERIPVAFVQTGQRILDDFLTSV